MANALPIKVAIKVRGRKQDLVTATPLMPRQHRTPLNLSCSPIEHPAVRNLDDTIAKIGSILSTSEHLIASSNENTKDLQDCLEFLTGLGHELATWRHSQLDEWQPRQLTQQWRRDFCCGGRLKLWPGAVETYYDCTPYPALLFHLYACIPQLTVIHN